MTFTVPSDATVVGVDVTGRGFCVIPSGTATLGVPPGETLDGAAASGAMLNPQANAFMQGYDERGPDYDAGLTVSGDVTVTAGDVIVKSEAAPSPAGGNVKLGLSNRITALHVLSSATNAGGMLPAPVGWTNRDDAPRRFDLNAMMAQHVEPHIVDMSGGSALPDTAALVERTSKGMFLLPQAGSSAGDRGQHMIPRGYVDGENYGGTIGLQWCSVIRCIYDSRTPEDHRRALFTHAIRAGIDIDDPWAGFGKTLGGNGGIENQFQGAVLLKRIAYGETLAGFMAGFPGNWAGAFVHTTQTIAESTEPHSNADSIAFPGSKMPSTSRIRTLVSVAGNDVVANFSNLGATRLAVKNVLRVKRVSDGASALIVGATPSDDEGINRGNNDGIATLTLDAQPDPAFEAGQEFYLVPNTPLVVGDADWSACGQGRLLTEGGWENYRPDAPAGAGVDVNSYRGLQHSWGLQFWVADKLSGGLPSEFEPVRQYILAADAGQFPPIQENNVDFWDAVKADLEP